MQNVPKQLQPDIKCLVFNIFLFCVCLLSQIDVRKSAAIC